MIRISLALAGCALVLTGCAGSFGSGSGAGSGFEGRYLVARNALDAGRYDMAERGFAGLMQQTSNTAVSNRLALELAHTHLRQRRYPEAAQLAQRIADSETEPARALALAVVGTAHHEQARAASAAGDRLEARARLALAEAALSDMLETAPGLDEGGVVARRLAMVRADPAR